MEPVFAPYGAAAAAAMGQYALEEEDGSLDEDEEEEAAAHRTQVDRAPRLLAELNASINDAHTYREAQRRRLQ